jgi:transcriptional regulator GlxA family with amidase domain
MDRAGPTAVEALIAALPETAGSALYGMVDVLAATGTLWRELVGEAPTASLIQPKIVALSREPFRCGHGIPVIPDVGVDEDPEADIVVLPELWLAPDDDMKGRYPELLDWISSPSWCRQHDLFGLLGCGPLGRDGSSERARGDVPLGLSGPLPHPLPDVQFRPEPNLVFADRTGRIVTAGGTTSWHDLAIHIIARHCSPGEALRIAKVYLLKWHGEGQLPYASLVRRQPHADAVVRHAEDWLAQHFREPHAVAAVVAVSGIPERSLKRRFKAATGSTLIGYVQNLRIEEAKRMLETGHGSFEDAAAEVGYENPAFFRRLFKRCTGLTPWEYRRMFRPFATATDLPAPVNPAAA